MNADDADFAVKQRFCGTFSRFKPFFANFNLNKTQPLSQKHILYMVLTASCIAKAKKFHFS